MQRDLVYLTAAAAFLLVARRARPGMLVAGVLTAITAVAAYALATRLFPDEFGYETGGPYQLLRPLGYWNALGILGVLGLLLALGVVGEAPRRIRPFATAAVPVLAATTYFTFSRGAWVALAAGVLVLVSLHPQRARVAAASAVVVPVAAVTVLVSSRADALTHAGAPLDAATRDGHRLAFGLVALVGLAAVAAPLRRRLARPRPAGRRARRGAALALAVVMVGGAAALVVGAGGPSALIGRSSDAFRGPFTQTGGSLNSRLLSTSGNSRADYWSVAWSTAADRPLHGAGAGTFDIAWYRERPGHVAVRDAHSLYLETLAELGVPGLLLLGAVVLVPLVAAFVRRHWAAASAAGAFSAYLVHAGLDWDWEIPAVTLAALAWRRRAIAAARPVNAERTLRRPAADRRTAAAAIVAVAVVHYAGAEALLTSRNAFDAGASSRPGEGSARHAAGPVVVRGAGRARRGTARPRAEAGRARACARGVAKDRTTGGPGIRLGLASTARSERGRKSGRAARPARRRSRDARH